MNIFCALAPGSWMLCFYHLSDVDECSLGQSHCSNFASCYNTPGSYKCKCKDGYRGMGHNCKRENWETKRLAPDAFRKEYRASRIRFLCLCFKKKGHVSSNSKAITEIPFFVMAVSHHLNPPLPLRGPLLLRKQRSWPFALSSPKAQLSSNVKIQSLA